MILLPPQGRLPAGGMTQSKGLASKRVESLSVFPCAEEKPLMIDQSLRTLVRHEGDAPRERSTCGWRDRLISREDTDVAAWAHAVDIDGAREHYHKRSTELYYVLEGDG